MSSADHVASWYKATRNDQSQHPSLAGKLTADVCIIGAGYTGLHSAIELAERGYRVVVLEARRVGWGASGRNGGQSCTACGCGLGKGGRWMGRAGARRHVQP